MEDPAATTRTEAGGRRRLTVLVLVVVLVAAALYLFGGQLSLASLADREEQLRQLHGDRPALVYGVAFLLYTTVTALSLPVATTLTVLYAWLFHLIPAVVLVSFASTLGACMAFLLSRYLFRDLIRARFGQRLDAMDVQLKKEGVFYLLTLRLLPIVPFFIVNLVMGLTPISVRSFWWASQLGMLPATLIYCYAGTTLPNLKQLAEQGPQSLVSGRILFALALLGIFPIVSRLLLGKLGWLSSAKDS